MYIARQQIHILRYYLSVDVDEVDSKIYIESPEEIEKLFNMIHPLLYDDEKEEVDGESLEESEFEKEQNLVSSLTHLIRCESSTDKNRCIWCENTSAKAANGAYCTVSHRWCSTPCD